jgi:hypothetical protein
MPQHAKSDDLMHSLLGKLNQIMLGGEDGQPSPNYFCTWAAPGIPYPESDFAFMQAIGVTDADEMRRRNQQAYIWSRFVDFLPDISGVYDTEQQEAIYQSDGTRLSTLWEITLRLSEVAAIPLTEQQKETLKRIDTVLSPTKTEVDILTGETVTRPTVSAMEAAYEQLRAEYELAVVALNAKRIAASVGADAAAVADYQFNGSVYRMRPQMAMNAWLTRGRKLEYERLVTAKEDILGRSLAFVRRDLRQRYQNALLTSVMDNQDFPVTGVIPPNFAEASGWTEFGFEEGEHHAFSRASHSSFSARGGFGIGPFRFGASSGYSRSDRRATMNGENFSMSFELCQAPILRSWFSPWFVRMRAWRFPPNIPPGLLGGEIEGVDSLTLSNGERPPRGHMIAYPTSAIFARNIKIRFKEFERESNEMKRHLEAGGSVGWGPFRVGGKYSRGSHEREVKYSFSGQWLTVPGAQIIGFKNYIMPQSPFPHPGIERWESGEDPTRDVLTDDVTPQPAPTG